MKTPTLSSETVHASAVAIQGRAVLIAGLSGKGKSDLALRLIDRGAALVSDDYTIVRRVDGRLVATGTSSALGKSRRPTPRASIRPAMLGGAVATSRPSTRRTIV